MRGWNGWLESGAGGGKEELLSSIRQSHQERPVDLRQSADLPRASGAGRKSL